MRLLTILLSLSTGILALPTTSPGSGSGSQTPIPLTSPIKSPFPIHHSCNATAQRQLATALQETVTLVEHAKEHILRWGNESEIYRKYFGDRPSLTPVGAYEVIVNGNNEDVLFRCDDPDENCQLDGWAGHWRGSNGTSETVICDLSFTSRRWLSSMCGQGYTISGSETNTFWAGDLLHRLFHVPAIGQGLVEHFADGYEDVLDLASGNGTEAVHDSEALQYFALEAYAYDVAVPGVGCVGEEEGQGEGEGEGESQGSGSGSGSQGEDEDEQEIPENCHTHDGGELHCT